MEFSLFLAQEAARKVIGVFADKAASQFPGKRGGHAHLVNLHRALSQLVPIIDQLEIALCTRPVSPEDTREAELATPMFSMHRSRDVTALGEDAAERLVDIAAALNALRPGLEVFAPDALRAINAVYGDDQSVVLRIEAGMTVEGLDELRTNVVTAKEQVAAFIRANYSFKDLAP